MRFCSLGSGSRGNAHIVEHGDTTLLIDCGFSRRELRRRLAARHLTPAEITAVIISHEHADHACPGAAEWAEFAETPFYMSAGTAKALSLSRDWRCLAANAECAVGDLLVRAVPVPHDVAEPLQFVIEDGARRLALFTDLGHAPPAVVRACADADMLVVECNYDETMLRNSAYPERVKTRIAGAYGHLSNAAAADLVRATGGGRRRHVVAAHLSENNNTPALAERAVAAADAAAAVCVATQAAGTAWLAL